MLERSIAYHDSDGRFATSAIAIELSESRPDGGIRKTSIVIDNGSGRFEMRRVVDDGREVYIRVDGDDVKVSLDGSTTFSEEEAEQYRLAPEQAKRTRNYYIYLYGLPMKLLDPGTRLDPKPREKDYQGHAVYELKVTYDEEVFIHPTAKAEVREVYRWYYNQSPSAAEKWLGKLLKAVETLSTTPERCALAPENDAFGESIRQLLYGKKRGTLPDPLHGQRRRRSRASHPPRIDSAPRSRGALAGYGVIPAMLEKPLSAHLKGRSSAASHNEFEEWVGFQSQGRRVSSSPANTCSRT